MSFILVVPFRSGVGQNLLTVCVFLEMAGGLDGGGIYREEILVLQTHVLPWSPPGLTEEFSYL
jgi:hypothetical protein